MKAIAQFFKVSPEQFLPAAEEELSLSPAQAQAAYDALSLPTRATVGSAGYDFRVPADISLEPGQTAKVPTGIRAKMEPGWVLQIYPRSGLGFKYRLQLDNTVGIIDSDYFFSSNEGHIFIKITNDTRSGKALSLKAGDGFAQGVFLEYGITVDDEAQAQRDGGFGSTGR